VTSHWKIVDRKNGYKVHVQADTPFLLGGALDTFFKEDNTFHG